MCVRLFVLLRVFIPVCWHACVAVVLLFVLFDGFVA